MKKFLKIKNSIMITVFVVFIIFIFHKVYYNIRYEEISGNKKYIETYSKDSLILMDKFRVPKLNDIVHVDREEALGTCLYRIVGMPGDTVEVNKYSRNHNSTYVNGKLVAKDLGDESIYGVNPSTETYYLKDNEYFVLGEDEFRCVDSRHFGKIDNSDIKSVFVKVLKD